MATLHTGDNDYDDDDGDDDDNNNNNNLLLYSVIFRNPL